MAHPLTHYGISLQVQLEPLTLSEKSKYTGIGQALSTIFKEEGIQGLWRGTVPGLLLTVPYPAVQFGALQQCKESAARMGISGGRGQWSLCPEHCVVQMGVGG